VSCSPKHTLKMKALRLYCFPLPPYFLSSSILHTHPGPSAPAFAALATAAHPRDSAHHTGNPRILLFLVALVIKCPHNSCFGITKSNTLEKSNKTCVFELRSCGVRLTTISLSPGPIGDGGSPSADETEAEREVVRGC